MIRGNSDTITESTGVIYSADDIVLFKGSPFASALEHLDLFNPAHGISPDRAADSAPGSVQRASNAKVVVAAIVNVVGANASDIALIGADLADTERRSQTLAAMRSGVEFIVNGQLAGGPLVQSVDLLWRGPGSSDLGDYVYMPCDIRGKTNLLTVFSLCALAELLQRVQGCLPPCLLFMRGGTDLRQLPSDDHIHHFRAVVNRLLRTKPAHCQQDVPDPAASSHFGRWSSYARDVLKRSAQAAEGFAPMLADNTEHAPASESVAGSGYDLDAVPATATSDRSRDSGDRRRNSVAPANALATSGDGLLDTLKPVPVKNRPAACATKVSTAKAHPLDSPGFRASRRELLPTLTELECAAELGAEESQLLSADGAIEGAPAAFVEDPAQPDQKSGIASFSDHLNTKEQHYSQLDDRSDRD